MGTRGSRDGGLRPAAAGARLGDESGSEIFAGSGAVEVGGGQAYGSEPADGDPLGGGEWRSQGAEGADPQAGSVQGDRSDASCDVSRADDVRRHQN